MGVEEEFLLVDPAAGTTAPLAAPVLARAVAATVEAAATGAIGTGAAGTGGAIRFSAEMLSTQVESITGICTGLDQLREELVRGRAFLAAAARAEGVRLAATGTAVLPGADPPVTEGARFARIAGMYEAVVRDYQCCGCHVHVGVPDHETAVAVTNHLRPWLPTLVALSANSPYAHGRDTGYQSWRMLEQARFPGAGVPPYCASAAEYDRTLDQLVDFGVLADPSMTFWLARPSTRYPTVEVRAADTALGVDDAVLQAALTRALVRTALAALDAGREAPPVPGQVCAAALWAAARHGISGDGVHPVLERPLPAVVLAEELLVWVRPALEDAGDLGTVRSLLDRLRREGTGATRQRRAAAAGLPAVVAMLAEHTAPDPGSGASDPDDGGT
ncbi:carboxylate-amine ligase [Actinomadura macrotermitis]|nr:glutamate--cysteine ligase [Actinomadura macrotermitis]